MALNVQPSILKTKTGHLPDSGNANDEFREFALLADAASSAASNNGNYSNNYHTPSKRKKQDPKTGKGLRHFSMKVSVKIVFVIFVSLTISLTTTVTIYCVINAGL